MLGGELEVRRLGFGSMRVVDDREEGVRVVRRAVELGVNFIDTADIYGAGRSEEIIAEALHPYPEGLVITTKGGLGWGLQERIRDGRPEHLREACDASLRRLKLERIDLYQLHRHDPEVPIEESIGALEQLRQAGKIRMLGAESYEVSSDGTVLTFKLRPDAKFSDGSPVTARDYEWTMKRNLDPASGSKYAALAEVPGLGTSTFFAFGEPVLITPTLSYLAGVPGERKPAMRWNRTLTFAFAEGAATTDAPMRRTARASLRLESIRFLSCKRLCFRTIRECLRTRPSRCCRGPASSTRARSCGRRSAGD